MLPFARSTPHSTLYVPSSTVRRIVDQQLVKCRFRLRAADGRRSIYDDDVWIHDADGCAAVLALCDVASHEAVCPFELLTCAHGPLHELPLCGAQFRRADHSAHDCVCAVRPPACAHGCVALLPPRALRDALKRGGADDAERAAAALVTHTRAHGVCVHSGGFIGKLLLQAMARNIEHAGLQREACALLEAITTDAAVRPVMATATTVAGAVLAAMRAHPLDESLHARACLALRQLSRGGAAADFRLLALAAAGGLQAVLDSMHAHPSNAAVQEAACRALQRIIQPEEDCLASR